MNSVILDAETIRKLTAFNGDRVAIRDEAGKCHGYFESGPTMTREEMEACFTPEQLARRANFEEPGIPMEDMLRNIGVQR